MSLKFSKNVGHPWPRTHVYIGSTWLKQAGEENRGKGGGVRIAGFFSVNYAEVELA
jgi:hypothetical protein